MRSRAYSHTSVPDRKNSSPINSARPKDSHVENGKAFTGYPWKVSDMSMLKKEM
jgi:hypothetical protein